MLHEIITSEKVPFTYQVAGIGSRLLAAVVDTGILVALLLMGAFLSLPFEAARPGLGTALMLVWMFALMFGYYTFLEWLWFGQTPGKRVMGIRVIQWDGTNIALDQSAIRNLLRIIDILPCFYGVGGVVALCNREQRRLGDLAANTLVVQNRVKPALLLPTPVPVTEAEKKRRELLHDKVMQLSRKQKQTILDLSLRRNQLRLRARAKLFTAVADYFRTELEVFPEEFESDEKFISYLASLIQRQDRAWGTEQVRLRK